MASVRSLRSDKRLRLVTVFLLYAAQGAPSGLFVFVLPAWLAYFLPGFHPWYQDDRHLVGKQVHLPLTGRTIPVIADSYVDREFGTGVVKVTDFGLAKPIDPKNEPALTAMGVVVGTPDYIAPEQARGEAIDERVDLYALGGTLYYLLIGSPPFRKGNPADDKYLKVVARHLKDPAPNPLLINNEIDDIRATVVRQTMFAEFEKIKKELKPLFDGQESITIGRFHVTGKEVRSPEKTIKAFSYWRWEIKPAI